jgi:Domain of unknown function (DUF5077)/Domain of unknown function (DUF3472)
MILMKNKMIQKLALSLTVIFIGFFSCRNLSIQAKSQTLEASKPLEIPLAGNAFITKNIIKGTEEISEKGLVGWTNKDAIISCYFKVSKAGLLNIAIKAKTPSSQKSSITVTVNNSSFTANLSEATWKTISIGSISIDKPGYVKVDLQGISRTGNYFAEVSDIILNGESTMGENYFANDSVNYYWSRRGPSCHLNYTTPNADKEYFYSELTVPVGEDKIGSYFMANGFAEGYFGIQVNSETERRILFSVWEPESSDKTTLIKKGNGVYAGRFDGEGTGGQSYLKFNWQAGTTYKFLTHGKPDGTGSTIYTSWFFAPEVGKWQLMASWKRPKISTYLTSFHGFLENFEVENGYLSRKALWSNQWVRLTNGTWSEVTEFRFSVDATGKNKQRMDFTGGLENGQFFLKNGGFFESNISPNTKFTKQAKVIQPSIDFSKLP